jgi:hypothetical protein
MLTFTFDGVENVGVKTTEIKIKRASIAIEDGELIFDNYTTPSRRVKLYGSPGLGRKGFQYDPGGNADHKIYRYEELLMKTILKERSSCKENPRQSQN